MNAISYIRICYYNIKFSIVLLHILHYTLLGFNSIFTDIKHSPTRQSTVRVYINVETFVIYLLVCLIMPNFLYQMCLNVY